MLRSVTGQEGGRIVKEDPRNINLEVITGALSASSIDLWSLAHSKGIFLTSGGFSFSIVNNYSYPARFTHTFFRGSYEVGLPQDA